MPHERFLTLLFEECQCLAFHKDVTANIPESWHNYIRTDDKPSFIYNASDNNIDVSIVNERMA